MSYCVNCGVELDSNARVCPLCQTPVWQPPQAEPRAPYFPTKPAVVKAASKRTLALLITLMLFSAALCCGVLNLFLRTARPWSLYVIGATVMLWIWFVLPMLLRQLPSFLKLTLDVAAIGIYIFLISIELDGGSWFQGLALPILGVACMLVFLLSFLLRGHRRSLISAVSLSIGAVGLFALGVEWALDRYFTELWQPGWSLIVLVVCAALIIPLRIIRHVPSLREEVRRRLSL